MAGPAPTRAYGRRHAARPMAALTALVIALTAVWVVEAPGAVAEAPRDGIPTLFVVRGDAEHDDGVLSMGAKRVKWFSDRPHRDVGTMKARRVVQRWEHWGFAEDPPNAALVGDDVDAVVELSNPRIRRGRLRFDVKPLDGPLPTGDLGAVALFIDSTDTAGSGLQVENNTQNPVDVALVWTIAPFSPDAMPVVWRSNPVPPTGQQSYSWQGAFDFVWGTASGAEPGAVVDPQAVAPGVPVNQGGTPSDYSQTLVYGNGDFSWRYEGAAPAPTADTLYAVTDASVPLNDGVFGVGIDGSPIIVAPTQPNLMTRFEVAQLRLWVVAGDFEPGEILDPETFAQATEITFPAGVGTMRAVYNADGTWSVSPA